MTYVDAYINNDTTVLFMRKTDSFNEPFITIEVFDNVLMQAYHRFNEDCTAEEAEWILNYCYRHGIKTGNFKFNRDVDELIRKYSKKKVKSTFFFLILKLALCIDKC